MRGNECFREATEFDTFYAEMIVAISKARGWARWRRGIGRNRPKWGNNRDRDAQTMHWTLAAIFPPIMPIQCTEIRDKCALPVCRSWWKGDPIKNRRCALSDCVRGASEMAGRATYCWPELNTNKRRRNERRWMHLKGVRTLWLRHFIEFHAVADLCAVATAVK